MKPETHVVKVEVGPGFRTTEGFIFSKQKAPRLVLSDPDGRIGLIISIGPELSIFQHDGRMRRLYSKKGLFFFGSGHTFPALHKCNISAKKSLLTVPLGLIGIKYNSSPI
jgi:hypothetical protein